MAVNKNNVKIHVEHLKKNFGNLEVLRDVSTDIYEGEVVVVLGPSGSGKSTFLRCLNRLEEITGGTVIVDGHDLTALAAAFEQAKALTGAPTMILAKTVKGKGVSFMEDQAGWHGKAPNEEQYQTARQELVAALAEKEGK